MKILSAEETVMMTTNQIRLHHKIFQMELTLMKGHNLVTKMFKIFTQKRLAEFEFLLLGTLKAYLLIS